MYYNCCTLNPAVTAQQYIGHWQNIIDALLDENTQHVLASALAATTALLTASLGMSCSTTPATSPGSLLLRVR